MYIPTKSALKYLNIIFPIFPTKNEMNYSQLTEHLQNHMMTLEFFIKHHNITSLPSPTEDDSIISNQMLTLDNFLKKKESDDDEKQAHQEELEKDNSFMKNQLLALDFFLNKNYTENIGGGNGDGNGYEVNFVLKIFSITLCKHIF